MKKYYYPRLSLNDFAILRCGGPGLANCMFFAAMAYLKAKIENGVFIEPTWTKFSIGPLLRKEKDKRVYSHLFNTLGIHGLKKVLFIFRIKLRFIKDENVVIYGPYDMAGYFTLLNPYHESVKNYFKAIEKLDIISAIKPSVLSDAVALHVRMGDYPDAYRVPLSWYQSMIKKIKSINPNQKFILFSDGSEEELKPLLQINNVEKVFFGNAYADIKAISYTKLLLASDSTFSAWGAFLGDVPILFQKRHFPSVFMGRIPEFIITENDCLPKTIIELFR